MPLILKNYRTLLAMAPRGPGFKSYAAVPRESYPGVLKSIFMDRLGHNKLDRDPISENFVVTGVP
jgi:hypothetical protein